MNHSLEKLIHYIERNNYKGYDPYDLLKSPLFQLPILKSNKTIRFLAQQVGKRSPVNIRPLLLVPKGYNPVTLGLCIQGYAYLFGIDKKQEHLNKINFLVDELEGLIPKGFSGACWGYDFPWAARHANIPAYQPTVVATSIITNGLYECYKITGNEKAKHLCVSAAEFVVKDLNRTSSGNSFCFSYSPFDHQLVFNASMKGARILAQAYALTQNEHYKETAQNAVEFVVQHQNTDGSWYYSLASKGGWIDNYHTGYVLDCLDEYARCTNDNRYDENLRKGFKYYQDNFFEQDGKPKFYNHHLYPIDCTAAGQSILTLTRFGDIEKAEKVKQFTCNTMQHPKGYFRFRKHKYYTQSTSFMRWSNAWMMVGMAYLQNQQK